ncbi:MAG: DNA polymerase III [Treponema sp.]|nr:DNA polymerase III [Treponema sp.]
MFDNVLFQQAAQQFKSDITSDTLPGALLLSGPEASGKLTCALELARIVSCQKTGAERGAWTCTCPSCLQHKALVQNNVLLCGPRDCSLEIAAAKKTFLQAVADNASYQKATRYLFIRSVKKLTLRFSPLLWQDDDKLSKIAPHMAAIDEMLEELYPPRDLPVLDTLQKLCDDLEEACKKLEQSYLYASLPILHVRNAGIWAHMSATTGKKVIIIENADRMLESVRNALLKMLEEPPEETIFVLTTTRRNAVMPTILSRVRTYAFGQRSLEEQKVVLERVFHDQTGCTAINDFLLTYLPVAPQQVQQSARTFVQAVSGGHLPDVAQCVKDCADFDPRILYRLFLLEIMQCKHDLLLTASGASHALRLVDAVRKAWLDVTVYNQAPREALEELVRSLSLALRR